jgi:hypothetical protein
MISYSVLETLSWLAVILIVELQTDRIFHRYGYQLVGNGRWQSMVLKKPKKAVKAGKRKAAAVQQGESEFSDGDDAVKTQEAKNTEV